MAHFPCLVFGCWCRWVIYTFYRLVTNEIALRMGIFLWKFTVCIYRIRYWSFVYLFGLGVVRFGHARRLLFLRGLTLSLPIIGPCDISPWGHMAFFFPLPFSDRSPFWKLAQVWVGFPLPLRCCFPFPFTARRSEGHLF